MVILLIKYQLTNITRHGYLQIPKWHLITDTKTVQLPKKVSDTETVPPTDTKMGTEQVPKRDTHKTNKTIKQYIPRKYKIRVPIPSDFGISKRVEIWAIKKSAQRP